MGQQPHCSRSRCHAPSKRFRVAQAQLPRWNRTQGVRGGGKRVWDPLIRMGRPPLLHSKIRQNGSFLRQLALAGYAVSAHPHIHEACFVTPLQRDAIAVTNTTS